MGGVQGKSELIGPFIDIILMCDEFSPTID